VAEKSHGLTKTRALQSIDIMHLMQKMMMIAILTITVDNKFLHLNINLNANAVTVGFLI
jgi:hypothetical protein